MPLEIRNASLALRIASLFEVMSSRGTSSMLSIEWLLHYSLPVSNIVSGTQDNHPPEATLSNV